MKNKPRTGMFMSMVIGTSLGLACAGAAGAAEPAAKEAPAPAARPRVLLLGDSICGGYGPLAQKALQDEAEVVFISHCGETANGLENLDAWLGERSWSVIHFNFGLHDMKYVDQKGERTAPDKGRQLIPPADYEKNLATLVARLKRTGAALVWATITPVPAGANGRVMGDEAVYNAAAARVMDANGIAVNDLCGALGTGPALEDLRRERNNVHFKPKGYQVLADAVVKSVRPLLKQP